MHKAPLSITVIVPCYNAASYIAQALDSVLAQTLLPDEIIVIDDGSTDQSAAVAATYGGKLRVFRHDVNEGIAAARNAGLRIARGDLIAFLDADDLWPPDSLQVRQERLREDPAIDAVFGRVESFVSAELPEPFKSGLAGPEVQPGRLAGALLVRRQIFERVGTFDTRLQVGETLDWIARAEQEGIRMEAVDTIVLRRRIHQANTVSRTQRLHRDYLQVLRASLARRRAGASDRDHP